MSRRGRGLDRPLGRLALLVLSLLGGLVAVAVPGAGQETTEDDRPPVLVRQSPVVGSGDTFEAVLDPASVPADGTVELVLHGRIRSRSELAVTMQGDGLRSTVYQRTTPVSDLVTASGALRVALSLDPTRPGSLNLVTPGVYPLEIRARDAGGAVLGRLITHLVRAPEGDDESPPLAVAVVARTLTEPALAPSGERTVPSGALDGAAPLLAALAGSAAPVSLSVSADAVAALAEQSAAGDAAAGQALTDLQAVVQGGALLAGPYAPTSPDALLAAGLGGELAAQLDAAAASLRTDLDVAPRSETWWAGPDLADDGARALARLGIRRVVLDDDQVEPLRPGLLSLSLAQPYALDLGDGTPVVEALEVDPLVTSHLETDLPPALEANRALAELAMLWFEQPGVPRAAVVPVDEDVRPAVVTMLLDGLTDGRVLQAVPLDEAFDFAAPLVQPGGARVDRTLAPADEPEPIARAVRTGLDDARALLAGLGSLLGDDPDAQVPAAAAHLLLATSTALSAEEQEAHLDAVGTAVDALVAAVAAPARETITLTARDGTVPLVVRNDGEVPIETTLRLSSAKLEFPEGDVVPLSLPPGSTRVDLAVRARASGSIPLTVTITSPDGSLTLAEVDYSIRSTAVAGMGVILSAGAALFLLVWWARHWHRTRRAAKLVEAKHLSHPSGRARSEAE
ncbi:MAG: DUF6049 family protein [Actinomycetota bacterium]